MTGSNRSGAGGLTRLCVAAVVTLVSLVAASLPAVTSFVFPRVEVAEAASVAGEIMGESLLCDGSMSVVGYWETGMPIGTLSDFFGPTWIGRVWMPAGATVTATASGSREPAAGNGGFTFGIQEIGNGANIRNKDITIANRLLNGNETTSWTNPVNGTPRMVDVFGHASFKTNGLTRVDWELSVVVTDGDGGDGIACEAQRRRNGEGFGAPGSGGSAGDPVNTATGNMFDQIEDIAAPGVSGMSWSRTYNSQDDGGPSSPGLEVPAVLGAGWSTLVDVRLQEIDDHLEFRGPDGVRHRLTGDASSGWVGSPRFVGQVAAGVSGGYVLSWPGEGSWTFDASGRVTRFDDGTGRSVRVARSAGGAATSIQAYTGEAGSYEFELVDDLEVDGTAGTDGRVDHVDGPGGLRVDYGYFDDEVADGAAFGRLAWVSRPFAEPGSSAGIESYVYDGVTGELLTITTSVGGGLPDVVRVANVYDAQGRVVTQTMPSGDVATFDYGVSYESLVTTVSHSGGPGPDQELVYSHDVDGRLVGITDPDGEPSSWDWEDSGQLAGSVDRMEAASGTAYDGALRPEVVSGPDPDTASATVDDAEVSYCDASADDPRVLSSTDAAGTVTEFTYGDSGQGGFPCVAGALAPSSMTVAAGTPVAATTTFDSVDGLITEVTDPDGVVVTSEWDETNQLLLSVTTDEDTSVAGVLVTYFGYDAMGRLRVTRTPEGIESWTTYNADGSVASQVGPVQVPPASRSCDGVTCAWPSSPPAGPTVTYTYWGDGRLKSRTDEAGETWSERRDYLGGAGWTDTSTEPDGDVRVAVYDAAENLAEERVGDPANTGGDLLAVTTHEYGILGRRVLTVSPEGVATHYRYNDEGLLTETTTGPDEDDPAHTWTTGYDLRGRVTSELGPTGDVDEHDDPVRQSTTYTYDSADRVTSTTTGTGPDALVTSTVYDPLGRVRFEITDTDGDGAPNDPVAADPADRDPGDLVIEHTYTPAGRPLSVIRPPADAETFDWVDGDQEAKRATTFGYDDAGRMDSVTRPDGEVIDLTLDGDGRTVRRDDPAGFFEAYTYNPRGQATVIETPSPTGTGTVVATATYDDRGAVLTETEPHPATETGYPAQSFVYNPDGSLWKARVTPLAGTPQGRSSKFPTLGGLDSRCRLLR